MSATFARLASGRGQRAQNRKLAIALVGVMVFLMAVAIVTILVKH